jgi:hypothetical protein
VVDVLPRHADVVGDLVGLIALLGTRQDAGAAQAVNGRMVGVVGVDVPIVFLDLGGEMKIDCGYRIYYKRTARPLY